MISNTFHKIRAEIMFEHFSFEMKLEELKNNFQKISHKNCSEHRSIHLDPLIGSDSFKAPSFENHNHHSPKILRMGG